MTANNAAQPLVVVTGGASGIGAAFSKMWADAGGRIAIIDLHADAIEATARRLGGSAIVSSHRVDVTDDDAVRAALDNIGRSNGGVIDAVVNCAGIARPVPAAESADREWTDLVDVHLFGTMRVCRAAFPFLIASTRPAIVNLSSVAAAVGMPGRSSYSTAKAGVEGLTRALAVEWAPQKIRVNAVAPGYVNSEMTAQLVSDGHLSIEPILARTPLGRLAEPAEISAVIFFLASPLASYITGQTLYVDGGMTADGNWYE